MKKLSVTALLIASCYLSVQPEEKTMIPLSTEQIVQYLPKNSELEDYINLYEDPDLKLEFNVIADVPQIFADSLLGKGIDKSGDFINIFFNKDRYKAKRYNKDTLDVAIYDVDSNDTVEDSLKAKANELLYDLEDYPRKLAYSGEGSVKFGINISGKGIGTLQYEGDDSTTNIRIDAYIETDNLVSDAAFFINSIFGFYDLSEERLKQSEIDLQKNLDYALGIVKSDSAYAYVDSAVIRGRITPEFAKECKDLIDIIRPKYCTKFSQ